MFPDLAWQWNLEVTDRENWQQFTLADFERLKKKYGVAWVIVVRPGVSGLSCPYANSEAVSYTHLDVYKRQSLSRPAFACDSDVQRGAGRTVLDQWVGTIHD